MGVRAAGGNGMRARGGGNSGGGGVDRVVLVITEMAYWLLGLKEIKRAAAPST